MAKVIFTAEQLKSVYGTPQAQTTQPVEQTKQSGVVSNIAGKLQNAPGAIGSIAKAVVGADKLSGDKMSSKLEQYGSDVAGQFQKAGERITQGVQQGSEQIQQGNVLGGIKTAGLRTAGSVAGAAFAPITEIPAVKKATEAVATSVMDKPEVKTIAEKLSSITQKYPELAQDATDILNLATLGGGKAVEKPAQEVVNSFLKPSNVTKVPKAVEGSFSANTMQRVARVPKGAQSKFKEISGENVGEYLVNRGIYGNRDEMATKLFDRFQQSKKVADDAFDKLPGQYQDGSIKDALDELVAREKRVSSANVPAPDLQRAVELQNKHDTVGLTMKETNEAKRLFEKNVKTGYFKENNADAIARATNIDTALRNWQFKQADMLGLENIQQINKETQAAKTLLDSLEKETTGQIGNNAVSLTDWIVLSGASDPRVAIASYLGKKTLGSEKVRSVVAKAFAPKATKTEIKAPIGETKYPRLPAGTVKNPTVIKPINLGSRSQSAIDEAEQKAIQSKLQNKQSKIKSEKPLVKSSTTSPKMSSLEDAKNNFDKRLREISPGQPESWYKSQLESQPFVKNPEKFGFKTKSMSSLEQEAKKYKSAEEFTTNSTELTYKNLQENPYSIKAYGKDFNEPVEYYRAGAIRKNGDIWLTDNQAGAQQYSSAGGGTKVGSYIVNSKKPLIIDTAGGKYAKGNIDINKILTKEEIAKGYTNNPDIKQKFIDYAKNNGYDAVQFADSFPDGEGGMRSLVVWDKNKIKTKSQLEEIWKKANK